MALDAVVFVIVLAALGSSAALICHYIDNLAGALTRFWANLWAGLVGSRRKLPPPVRGFLIEDDYPRNKSSG
ncbi:MAG: hypothetical protein JO316_10600 [Abitibacteriaceae bacterium]|nr:hypothetical protein [Abditibacteriaceae bacterium]